MKQDATLEAELYGSEHHRTVDLVTLELAVGTQRWTSEPVPITAAGVGTFTPAPFERSDTGHEEMGIVVSSLDLVLPGELVVSGTRLLARALAGELHGARIEVRTAWIRRDGSIAGTDPEFEGEIDGVTPSLGRVEVKAASLVARLRTASLPGWFVQPACPFRVGDLSCDPGQTLLAGFTDARTVAAGSTTTEVELSSSSSRLLVGGWLRFTSGALAGRRAAVMEVLSAGLRARVDGRLPSAPQAADGVQVVRGCSGTLADCDAFGNRLRFGGAPYAPAEDGGRA